MSFGRLKSARQAKERHSHLKLDAPSSATSEIHPEHTRDSTSQGPSTDLRVETAAPNYEKEQTDEEGSQLVANMDVDQLENTAPQTMYNPETEKTKLVPIQGCHSSLPSTLEIRESSRLGRGLYTKSAFAAGAIIMSPTPHVSVLSTANLDHYCSACADAAPESGLKRCPKCQILRYCDSECQNRDWVWHKRECSALRKWGASAPSSDVAVPSEAVRCLGRILWGIQKEGLDSPWAKEIHMLHSNRTTLQPSAFESHTHLAHSVVRYLGVTSPQELELYGLRSAGDLVDLISRFTTNTFTLTTPALTPTGICVSPIVAFANHSCEPNAVIVFPRASSASAKNEPVLCMVALREITAGDEVRISYIDTTLPRRYRQKGLKEVYSFSCQCKLCARVSAADPREALGCPKGCGGICPHPTEENPRTRCANCNTEIGDVNAILDALRVGQEALDKTASLQFKDPEKAKQLTTNVIPILTSAGVRSSSHPLLAMLRIHLELLVASFAVSLSQDVLNETVRTAAKYSAGLQNLLPKGHPVRAVALGELGKLLAVDEPAPLDRGASESAAAGRFPPSGPVRVKLAYDALVMAHEELLIGFGKADGGGQIGREIRDAIVRLEKELGVWTSGIRNVLQDTVPGRVESPSK